MSSDYLRVVVYTGQSVNKAPVLDEALSVRGIGFIYSFRSNFLTLECPRTVVWAGLEGLVISCHKSVISATTRLIANSFETALPKWKWIRISERGKVLKYRVFSP